MDITKKSYILNISVYNNYCLAIELFYDDIIFMQ